MKIIIICLLNLFVISMQAQVISQGATVIIHEATVINQGDWTNEENAVIINEGTLHCEGSIYNTTTAFLSGADENPGLYIIHQDFENTGELNNFYLSIQGEDLSHISSASAPIDLLELSKTGSNQVVELVAPLSINDAIEFSADSNWLRLHQYHLSLGPEADVFGADDNNYIITNAIGHLYKDELEGSFYYPVGTEIAFHPATISSETLNLVGLRSEKQLTNEYDNPLLNHAWVISGSVNENAPIDFIGYWESKDEPVDFVTADGEVMQQLSDVLETKESSIVYYSKSEFAAESSIDNVGRYTIGNNNQVELDNSQAIVYATEQEESSHNNIFVYPNPSVDGIYLALKEKYDQDFPVYVSLYNATGQLVLQKQIDHLQDQSYWLQYPSNFITSGLYFLKVVSEGGLDFNQRIVIQKTE